MLTGGDFMKRTEALLSPISEAFAYAVYKNRLSYDEAVNFNKTK
jgi:hypothetical protein